MLIITKIAEKKEYNNTEVSRFRDVYSGSEFFHPESRIQGQKRFRIRIKEFQVFLTQNTVSKLRIRIMIFYSFRILDPEHWLRV
jgi:hypothetical protein